MRKFYLFLMAMMLSATTALAGDVYFYFQDGEEDDFEIEYPSQYVSIWNSTEDEPVAVPEDMAFMSYEVSEATILKIYPCDLDFELLVTLDGSEDMYMLDREESEWILTLFADADNLEVYVKVYQAGQAPGGSDIPEEVNLSFNVSAASGEEIENPGEKVSISYFDKILFTEAFVTVTDNYGTAEVVPGTSFTLSPAEGYAISAVTTFSDGVASISEPAEGNTDWYISVAENPADNFAPFFITVAAAPEVPEDEYKAQITEINGNYFDISWENVTSITEGDTTGAYIRNIWTDEKYDMLFLEGELYSKANLRIIEGNALRVVVTNNYPDLPTGAYEFYLPADYVKFNGTETGNAAIDGYEFYYEKPWSEGEVEFNGPSEDNEITLTWLDASAIAYDTEYAGDGQGTNGITIFDGNDYKIDVPYSSNITISGNKMTISLEGLEIGEGECKVMVPSDCILVTVDDITDYSDGVSFTFNYGNGTPDVPSVPELYDGEATWSVEEGGTVTKGTLVEVSWGDFTLSLVEDAEEASIWSFETGIFYLEYGKDVYLSEDKSSLILDLSGMEDGTYRINVPEACVEFEADGVRYRNSATSLDNVTVDNTSGVTAIEGTPDGRIRIIGINGTIVADSENADLRNLPKGIYVVNGRKVMK